MQAEAIKRPRDLTIASPTCTLTPVTGDFTLSLSPSGRTVFTPGSATYTVTGTSGALGHTANGSPTMF